MCGEILLGAIQRHCRPLAILPPPPRVSLSDVMILLGDGASNNFKVKKYVVNMRGMMLIILLLCKAHNVHLCSHDQLGMMPACDPEPTQ